MQEFDIYTIHENDSGRRMDRIVRKMFPGIPLSAIYKGIRKGNIRLNNKKVKQATITSAGDKLYVAKGMVPAGNKNRTLGTEYPEYKPGHQTDHHSDNYHQNDDLYNLEDLILYENAHLLALNKPRGLLVHGDNSLETMVCDYLKHLLPLSLSFKPGPVHRLDRNTSGLVFFSKSLEGAKTLSQIIREDLCTKYYLGLFDRMMEHEEEWIDPVVRDKQMKKTIPSNDPGARKAIMKILPLLSAKQKTLGLCIIKTGITHQIRAQAGIHSHPLTGDKKYGSNIFLPYYILHAWGIRFDTFNPVINRTIVIARIPESSREKLCSLLGTTRVKAAISEASKMMNAR
jgi:23S rRNA pseudouridine955/2504/2580 synthase